MAGKGEGLARMFQLIVANALRWSAIERQGEIAIQQHGVFREGPFLSGEEKNGIPGDQESKPKRRKSPPAVASNARTWNLIFPFLVFSDRPSSSLCPDSPRPGARVPTFSPTTKSALQFRPSKLVGCQTAKQQPAVHCPRYPCQSTTTQPFSRPSRPCWTERSTAIAALRV